MSEISLSGHYGYRRILRTMLPMVLAVVVVQVYSIVDGFFVSNFVGSIAFASMNMIWPVLGMVASLGIMVGSGGSALASKTIGEGDPDRACRIFTILVRVSLVMGIVLGAALFLLMDPLARLLGAEGEMVPQAVLYGRIIAAAMPVYMLQMTFPSFYMTAERPQLSMRVCIVSGLANVLLDFLLVVVFPCGLAGAAFATVASMAVGAIFPLLYFSSRRNTSHLRLLRHAAFDLSAVARSMYNGLSEFVGSIAMNVVSICYNLQLMRYVGQGGVAAYGIIMYVSFLFGSVFIGYNQGITQVVAYNYGARNHAELTSLLHKSLLLIVVGGLAICGACELSSPLLARVFVGYDPQLTDLATRALRLSLLGFLFNGFGLFSSAWFTALNNGTVSALIAVVRTLVLEMACIFLLPLLWGVDGIWVSWPMAELLATGLTFALLCVFRTRYGY